MGTANIYEKAFLLTLGALFINATVATANEPTVNPVKPLLVVVCPSEPAELKQAQDDPQPVATENSAIRVATEVIQERYPNGAIKIAREVVQDSEGNYVNHGPWQHWDTQGNLVAEGQYRYGRRHGAWTRQHAPKDSPLFSTIPYIQFEAPYLSQASFDNGEIHGSWAIYDTQNRKIVHWQFTDGERHGTQTWYYPNANKMRTIIYDHGTVNGQLALWDVNGELVREETYQLGRKHEEKTTYFEDSTQKKTYGEFLYPKLVKVSNDEWWNARPATFKGEGKTIKHGPWTAWHPNGQIAVEGRFEYDLPVGQFVWWFSNGQKAQVGDYEAGHATGNWVWWHANGQKKTSGAYEAGVPMGPWSWWKTDGKLTNRADFSEAAANIATRPETSNSPSSRRAPTAPKASTIR